MLQMEQAQLRNARQAWSKGTQLWLRPKIRRLGARDLHGIVCHRAEGVLHALCTYTSPHTVAERANNCW